MMKVATAAEMKQIDRLAQTDFFIPGAVLMERAALSLRRIIEERFNLSGQKAYIFCGKGNNGGDGLALARLLFESAVEVVVVLAYEPSQFSGLASQNLSSAAKFGLTIVNWREVNIKQLQQAGLIVDALLGTGAVGTPGEPLASIITMINDAKRPVVAVDIPSGVNADNGQVGEPAIKANITVTFGLPKPGLLVYPGAKACGELVIEPIGFPPGLLESDALKINCLTAPEVGRLLPKRAPTAHKGSCGHVLVIGGAMGMTGAVALCGAGALRAGAGLVTAGIHNSNAFPEKPAEVMTLSWDRILAVLDKAAAVVFGPGASTGDQSQDLFRELLAKCDKPLVIDADGLNLLAAESVNLREYSFPKILTPHPGEMSRISGLPVAEIEDNRIEIARRFAQERGVTLVLKGARSIIADKDGNIYINPTGNPGMATAGMGDALAGIIGGLLAQGMSPVKAAACGTYLHGLAGDLTKQKYGPTGIITTDLLKEYPAAVKKVLE